MNISHSFHIKSIIYELLWFLKGDTNVKYLKDNGVSIWNKWADENGDLWMTTYRGGVWKYNGKMLSNFEIKNGTEEIQNRENETIMEN